MTAVCLIYQAWQHRHCELSFKKSQTCCSQWAFSCGESCVGQISKGLNILLTVWLLFTHFRLQTVKLHFSHFASVHCICMNFYICVLSENRPTGHCVNEPAETVSLSWSCNQCCCLSDSSTEHFWHVLSVSLCFLGFIDSLVEIANLKDISLVNTVENNYLQCM